MNILGIDEAGRGPVLGPLVMAGVMVDDITPLERLGVKDSKLLTKEQREKLYAQIIPIVVHKVMVLEPNDIDAALQSFSTNLNWLEAQTSAKILNALNPAKAVIDCPSPNIKAYHDYLKRLVNKEMELIVRHKAEEHPAVAAASIIAKVTRDNLIEQLKKEIGINFGSGYMSDPLTQQFLEEHHETHHHLFRKGWASYKETIVRKEQTNLSWF